MKTLYFQKHSPEKNLYYCSINGKCFEHDESGTYVLASESNECIKVSDEHFKESVEMYMGMINGLEKRIKVLEDALNFYQYVENYKSTTPIARGDGSYDYDVPVLIDNGEIARATLEVK